MGLDLSLTLPFHGISVRSRPLTLFFFDYFCCTLLTVGILTPTFLVVHTFTSVRTITIDLHTFKLLLILQARSMHVIRPFQLDISTMSFWGLKSPDQRAPLRRMGFFRFQQVNSIILQPSLLFVGYKSFSYRNSSFQSASCNIRSSFTTPAVYNVLLHWSGPLSSIVFIQVQTRSFHFFCVRCGPDPCIHCISLGLDCKKFIWERGSVTPPCVSTFSRTQYCTLYSALVPLDHYIRRCLNYFNLSTSRIYLCISISISICLFLFLFEP